MTERRAAEGAGKGVAAGVGGGPADAGASGAVEGDTDGGAGGPVDGVADVVAGGRMRIGDAAAAVGTTPRALRFYEECGLLPSPARTPAGQREYGPRDIARLRAVRELLALGLTVEDLRGRAEQLHAVETYPLTCDSCGVSKVVDRRIAVLDAEIERLTRLRASLAALAPATRP